VVYEGLQGYRANIQGEWKYSIFPGGKLRGFFSLYDENGIKSVALFYLRHTGTDSCSISSSDFGRNTTMF